MGTHSSKVYTDNEVDQDNRVKQQKKDIEAVESFAINVYASAPRNDSMWLILSSRLGQKAFFTYLKGESHESIMLFFLHLSEFMSRDLYDDDDETIAFFDNICTKLQNIDKPFVAIHQGLKKELDSLYYACDIDKELGTELMISLMGRLQIELVYVMAREFLTRFINSKNYKNWRAAENSHAVALTIDDTSMYNLDILVGSNKTSTSSWSSQTRNKIRSVFQPTDLVRSALSSMDSKELAHMLSHPESWLTALLAAAEALPISFTLATANTNRWGFPLIYANKSFEKATGFSREFVVGKSCKEFMQCEETEKEQIDILSEGLSKHLPCAAVVTNISADGRRYKNLVVLKPVANKISGKCAFIIGLQFDISREYDQGSSKLSLAQQLLEMLPTAIEGDCENENDLKSKIRLRNFFKRKWGKVQ